MNQKPPILALPLRDCTDEQITSLGLGGYRILAATGDTIVFALQIKLDFAPPDVRAAIEAANRVAEAPLPTETVAVKIEPTPITNS